jgi:hypothetical protein
MSINYNYNKLLTLPADSVKMKRMDNDNWADVEFLKKLIVGIGEVTEITGVPQRQIRYWESKGLIRTVDARSSVRRYNYPTIKKILLIKELLDEGFTLEAAAQKVEKRI